MKEENWFIDWFDSDYYHLLYKDRDFTEAERFIGNLFQYLKLDSSFKVLDLACGKGRHALQVHDLGYDVTGVDLSEESIKYAKQFNTEGLSFDIKDMRDLGYENQFDLVLNLFTSFGYFKKEGDNLKVIHSIANSLKKNGLLVLDYLNVHKVKQRIPLKEIVKRDEVVFNIHKKIENNFIVKEISFEKNKEQLKYYEYVKLFDLEDFMSYFQKEGLEILNTFGDYSLRDFEVNTSDRLILLARKK